MSAPFMIFLNRLWDSAEDNLSSHEHPLKKKKVKKPKKKGEKAESVEKITVAELLPQLENTTFYLDEQPYASLFKIYKQEFLDVSVSKNLIHPNSLALAGDGTPVLTSHRERKNASVTVKKKEFLTVIAIAIIRSLTVISAGILPMTVGIMATICICSWIHKVISLCFHFFSCASKHDSHGFFHIHFSE